jgi:hypothetical protein
MKIGLHSFAKNAKVVDKYVGETSLPSGKGKKRFNKRFDSS